jgi:predicted branched-subunit amino acid permease
MKSTTEKSTFWTGAKDGAPFLLVLAPFSMLFGVVATEAGLSVFEALSFSVVIIAGAAQFAAVQLLVEEAPTLVVILSALAINLRMAMYSASLAPHIGGVSIWKRAIAAYMTVDQNSALALTRFERETTWSPQQKYSYFIGAILPIVPAWYGFTLLGAVVGKAIPPELALDFALPLTFIAMIGPALRTPAHIAAAFVSVVVALLTVSLPYNLGLFIAGILGMMAGAQVELIMRNKGRTNG